MFGDISRLAKTRDLSLPDWGLYAKAHFALSHITDRKRGTLFECLHIPGIAGRKQCFPSKKCSLDYVPLDANADLSFCSLRCNITCETQADFMFFGQEQDLRLSETVFANNSRRAVNFRLDYALGFQFEGESVKLGLKRGEYFLPAHEYEHMKPQITGGCSDQRRAGTCNSPAFVRRLALQPSFTSVKGARATYRWRIPARARNMKLGVRYALSGPKPAGLKISVGAKTTVLRLDPTGTGLSFDTLRIRYARIGDIDAGEHELVLFIDEPASNGELHIDGFFLIPGNVEIMKDNRLRRIPAKPNLTVHSDNDFLAIKSPLAPDRVYGVMARAEPHFHVWKLGATDMYLHILKFGMLSRFWQRNVTLDSGNEHIYADLRPLFCASRASISIRAAIGFAPDVPALRKKLSRALENWSALKRRVLARHKTTAFRINDRRFRAGLESVMAATLTSVCFPQDFTNEYARYFSPGASYPTLYMWDAGMQGIGLMEYSPKLALEGLNTYLSSKNDPRPVVLHGTVLPTQMYLYWELFQRSGDDHMLKTLYPRMRRYYRFMAGKDGSAMDRFGSGLLCPWTYFYNSGGGDDYPPQVYVDRNRLGLTMSPVVNTAHTIRCARFMAVIARRLGMAEHIGEYLADAERMMSALLKYSWDEKAGYFSYVIDKGKRKLEYRPGVNYNMGMDGISPLVAGVDDPRIWRRLIFNCKTPKRLWTRLGLSTVDQSAPYFEHGGYWNGAVWVAHQWFFFRAMLDYGESKFAVRIAKAILGAWQQAVIDSHGQTFEGIDIKTGSGFGAPYFSALNVPAVSLYKSCFEPGRLTSGFDTLVSDVRFDRKRHRLTAAISRWHRPDIRTGLIANVGKPGKYACKIGSHEIKAAADRDGRIILAAIIGDKPVAISITPAR